MPIANDLAGRHLLLTGVTGFVGKVTLAMLLDQVPDIGRVTVLIRPRGPEGPVARFESMVDTSPVFRGLRARHGANLGRWLGARVEVLAGDVEKPRCGVDVVRSTQLAETLDVVVHCAGLTDFEPDPVRAVGVNVLGARHAAALARATGAHLMHVSTCYTAGVRDGDVPETLTAGVSPNGTAFDPVAELRELRAAIKTPRRQDRVDRATARAEALGWRNIYTYTKGLAEHLTTAMTPTTIVRPAIVECAMDFPFAGWNEGLNTAGPLAWLISTAFRRFPTAAHHRFDVIPVDRVARGLILIAAAAVRGEAASVYHLASSDTNPLTFGRAVELTGLGMRRWVRKGNGTPLDKALLQHLDPVPARGGGWFTPVRMRGLVRHARTALDGFSPESHLPAALHGEVGDELVRVAAEWSKQLGDAQTHINQVENMLRLFKPFVQDLNYRFCTRNIHGLSARLDGAERTQLGWDVADICWRTYWVDVEYPGLATWSIPIIRGESIPADAPSVPAFQLVPSAQLTRQASK